MSRPVIPARFSRRTLLRGAGVSLALPWLEALPVSAAADGSPPLRAIFVSNNLGILPKPFFPATSGPE
jgi:hypothetical protein